MDEDDPYELSPPSVPGDLGRRVRHWRERAGLSQEDLARRAGISAGYLDYLETQPRSFPTSSVVARIAAELGTSAGELLGGNVDQAPGTSPATRRSHLAVLDAARSWELLGSRGVGRIVFDAEDGPMALPMNYAIAEGNVLLRTDEDTVIAHIAPDAPVSFEVDRIDDATSSGWSVVIHANCEHLGASPSEAETYGVLLGPWAGGPKEHWIRLRPRSIAGRQIETGV